ncbi:MAG: branched-chain amino acid transport system II carrier protein [Comamonas sp.]|nr:branched-chain amino acid transport system II carrier protein [Comamonas sp.]
MKTLRTWDIFALGFMTFALFLGAGNIIFPPMVGVAAGNHWWWAAAGFLIAGVGLPLMTVVALARVGGGMAALTAPIGNKAGLLLGVVVYLSIGPFFATPRTATVAFEMAVAPFVGGAAGHLLWFSVLYFVLVMGLSLFPGRLMDTLGKWITPVLLLALSLLSVAAFVLPAGALLPASGLYLEQPLAQGFLQGYQTMDALGALVFGVVIVQAIQNQGVTAPRLHTRYTIVAAAIAAVGLGVVYISLMHLGAHSQGLAEGASTGAEVLSRYVQFRFAAAGQWLLAVVIVLACLTTGVGLVSACAAYFSPLLGVSHRTVVLAVGLFSMAVANQGLAQLIAVAVPALYTIYPVAITLVVLNLLSALWLRPSRVFVPALSVALGFGLLDGFGALGWGAWLPAWLAWLPGQTMGLGWLLPVALVVLLAAVAERLRQR